MAMIGKTGIKIHGTGKAFFIPQKVWLDSKFPFKDRDILVLEIIGKEVVVRAIDINNT